MLLEELLELDELLAPEDDDDELEVLELLDDEPPPEEEELELLPGVIPPLLQPCKANAPAATKIKAIFFMSTILSMEVQQRTRNAGQGNSPPPQPHGHREAFYGYNTIIIREVFRGERKPDLVLPID